VSDTPASILELAAGLFWPADPTARTAILLLVALAALVAVTVQGPLVVRLLRIGSLQRAVRACFYDETSNSIQRQQLGAAFAESPLAYHWDEFVRRWHNAIAADPIQDASLPELSRAPVRLVDVLREHPILAAGARRSLLPALPAIFLSAGLLGAFAALVLALPEIGSSLAAGHTQESRPREIVALLDHLGVSLRIGLWGLLLSLIAAVSGRVIEGHADVLSEALDSWVQLAYGSISTGELATRTAHEQRSSLLRLQDEVSELARELAGHPHVGPAQSTVGPAPAAERRAIEEAVATLGAALGKRLERSVAEELAAVRESVGSMFETVDRFERAAAGSRGTGELTQAVERLVKSSELQSTASRSLTQTTHLLDDASGALRAGLDELAELVAVMRAATPQPGAEKAPSPKRAGDLTETADDPDDEAMDDGNDLTPIDEIDPPVVVPPTSTAPSTSPSTPVSAPPPLHSEVSRRAGPTAEESPATAAHVDSESLSGLLRVTHHSGPSSGRSDPELPPDPARKATAGGAASDGDGQTAAAGLLRRPGADPTR
jgi:hypothetical protein